ncbi:MAG: Leucyl/phenylalanyl-tRNA--protein transferase [Micavibrio sp.]|nr:Leucyl/phenylalanyl-tRNA--protein transferase [Micavibrio sp.]
MKAQEPPPLPLHDVLNAYANGYFLMGDGQDDHSMHWYNPPMRAVMPIRELHISRKLKKLARSNPFEIRIDSAFPAVMEGCMENRLYQWITPDIRKLFNALHLSGYAHSIECWQANRLVGGIYGLALGGAFCAESMFSRVPGASKIALVHLCARLDKGGFCLLDCQILNEHTEQFGAHDIPKTEYIRRLHHAIRAPADFLLQDTSPPLTETALAQKFLGLS